MWKDEWFLDLEPDEKLLFMYLFTNDCTSLAGIYKIAFKVICFETGISKERVTEILIKFQQDKKVYYSSGVVFVTNMRRFHETKSHLVQTRIKNDIDSIPDGEIKGIYCKIYGIDRVSLKEEEEDEDKEEEEDTTQYRKLSVAFVNRSKVPELSGGVKRWNEGLQKLVSAGVEVQDVESAVDILREKDFTINSISSIVNTAISEMAKRKSGKNGHKPKSSNPLFQNQHNDNTDAEEVLAQLEAFEKGLSL